ncbi:DUF2627 family protein [Oceanobacillus polygoni]|uniref:Uncharacterized SAM-binding protein YcdF (DUF218 family) n=1 Tax=Oceanobacillus polygoni TaxID=1235259 RepID=A0A9X0YT40_9BACI|nr:DUF2627 family protein [Oceanobacillus polygoni]MBP2078243.1 uncharacterized SAM-binding protein YcdF (DUF218 family) [Oceanobacillus polygoni]
MSRFFALLLLFIPGVIAAIGIKLMRDTIFDDFYSYFFYPGIQFTIGLLLFIFGLLFLGGFIIYRDRKRQKIKQKDKNKAL